MSNQYMTDEGKAIVLEKLIKRCNELGFEYVDGYTGSEGSCNVRCMKCGAVYKKSCISIRHADHFLVCENCNEINKQRRKAEKQRASEIAKIERQRVRWLSMKATQLSMRECKECGDLFVGNRSVFCSDKCANAFNNRIHKDKRIRRKKIQMVDKDIDLKRLGKKEKNICWLCGEEVDWNDYEIKDGAFIAGDIYPSIDHVKPLCEGGEHSWANVRLAHRICNIKRYHDSPAIKIKGS